VKSRTRLAAGVLACAAAVLAITAATAVAAPAKSTATLKVGLVTDIGGLNDHGFNHLAYLGLQKAAKQLHVQTRVLESHANSDYIPNLSTLAQQGYDLVIAVGFLMADSVKTVAEQFPNTQFMIIDNPWASGDPANLEGTVFHEQEAGYLVGYLSGKCKNLALQQIQQGAKVVFQVAGGCGLGALDAAKQKHVWGIGVDADQAYLGPQILTSALKRVDNDVFTTIKQVQSGNFKGGSTFEFTVKNGGIGLGKVSKKVPKSILAKVNAVEKRIASGKIKIPTTVK
jgi:basic membrane protein A